MQTGLNTNKDSLYAGYALCFYTWDKHSAASGNLMIREVFGAKVTRTGSVAPSVRQKMSRKAVSPFSFFNRKASKKLSMSKNVSIVMVCWKCCLWYQSHCTCNCCHSYLERRWQLVIAQRQRGTVLGEDLPL